MAVTPVDVSAVFDEPSGTTCVTDPITVSSLTNGYALVDVAYGDETATGRHVTGVSSSVDGAFTLIAEQIDTAFTAGAASLWGLKNPTAGDHVITVTADSGWITMVLRTFSGVDQTTPTGTPVKRSSSSAEASTTLTLTGSSGGMLVDVASSGGDLSGPDGAQTQDWLDNSASGSAGGKGGGSHKAATGSSQNMIWNSTSTDVFQHVAVELKAVSAGVTAAVTGTATATIREAAVVAGGKTILLTLTGDTWLVSAGGLFDAQRQNIINGIDSAQSETHGWDAEVKANLATSTVVRTSDTVVTITLSAQAAYNITATETITVTVPSSATTLGLGAVVASPTFTVGVSDLVLTAASGSYALTGNATALTVARVPTRFYLSSTATADVSPAFEGGWGRTTEGDRREMSPTKDGSAATSKTVWANGTVAANGTALVRQYVSDAMAAGFTFQTSDTIKCYIRALESATNDNINRQPICVKVVSNDGTTVQATLLALGHIGPNTTEWATALTNKTWADGDALTTGYTTVSGDRLVVEIGAQVSSAGGTTVTGTLSFGSASGSDTGQNETDTAANNPWFEVNRTIPFFAGAYTLTAAGGSYAITGRAVNLNGAHKITATQGTYALTGQTALFHRGFHLDANTSDYAITGGTTLLKQGRRLVAAQGTYALTGSSANLVSAATRILLANAGSYTYTGFAAALNRGRRMTAVAGSYAQTGNATGLRWAHRLVATSGTYTYTGNAVTLHAASPPGAYLLTGNAVGLRWGHRLTCTSGTYALTGSATLFKRALRMTAVSGTYALNGQAVALTRQSTGAFSLGASPGSFTITGGTTNLKWGHTLTAVAGSYGYTGQAVGLLHFAPGGFTMIAEAGSYTRTGNAAGLLHGAKVGATSGSYALTGSALSFSKTFYLVAAHGIYLLTGQDVSMSGPPPVVTFYPGKYRDEWASALVDVREAGI